ncbi:MAG: lysostaphin resistance A-like protein [Acidiferrobacterales bacterium]
MQPSPEGSARPWGLAATALFSVLIAAVFFVVQELVSGAVPLRLEPSDADSQAKGLSALLLAVSVLLAAPSGIALILIFAALRRGISLRFYLALNTPSLRISIRWFVYLVIFILVFHAVAFIFGRPPVTDFELRAFRSVYLIPVLLLAFVVVAPCFEELFFRGFIFSGVASSALGVIGALITTSVLWAMMHAFVEILMIFAGHAPTEILKIFSLGLLLGYARWKTNSVYVPIGLHGLWNLSIAVETMLRLARF